MTIVTRLKKLESKCRFDEVQRFLSLYSSLSKHEHDEHIKSFSNQQLEYIIDLYPEGKQVKEMTDDDLREICRI